MVHMRVVRVALLPEFDGTHTTKDEVQVEHKENDERGEEEESNGEGDDHRDITSEELTSIDNGAEPLDETAKHHAASKSSGGEGVEEEEHEELVVFETDAVGDPGTVVVHAEHTAVTDTTVMSTIRLVHITSRAVSVFGTLVLQFALNNRHRLEEGLLGLELLARVRVVVDDGVQAVFLSPGNRELALSPQLQIWTTKKTKRGRYRQGEYNVRACGGVKGEGRHTYPGNHDKPSPEKQYKIHQNRQSRETKTKMKRKSNLVRKETIPQPINGQSPQDSHHTTLNHRKNPDDTYLVPGNVAGNSKRRADEAQPQHEKENMVGNDNSQDLCLGRDVVAGVTLSNGQLEIVGP